MSKTSDEFLDHFARLGVFSKVQALVLADQSNEIQPPILNSPTINATIPPTSANDSTVQNTSSTIQQVQTTGNIILYYRIIFYVQFFFLLVLFSFMQY